MNSGVPLGEEEEPPPAAAALVARVVAFVPTMRAVARSESRARPRASTSTLPGFTSLCTMPFTRGEEESERSSLLEHVVHE